MIGVRGVVKVGVGVASAALLCAGCVATSGRAQVPDVTGQQARVALGHLRDSGYEHFKWGGRWSPLPVGVVLATEPSAGSAAPHGVRVRLIMSQGPHTQTAREALVPGIGTCDLNPPLASAALAPACVGGPVMLPLNR